MPRVPIFEPILELCNNATEHRRRIANAVNQVLQGRMNATRAITLNANSGTIIITDPRLSVTSLINFMPTTANAAAELGNGTLYVSSRTKGSATLTHANNTKTDRTYSVLIIG